MSGFTRRTVFGLAAAFSLAASGAVADDKLKVGFVYVGPVGDHGWTYEHNQGRLAIEEALGEKVETTYVENVSEGPDAERVITQLAQKGHDLIFTTSLGFTNPNDVVTISSCPFCARCVLTRPASGPASTSSP